jgi:hypothetical protein
MACVTPLIPGSGSDRAFPNRARYSCLNLDANRSLPKQENPSTIAAAGVFARTTGKP